MSKNKVVIQIENPLPGGSSYTNPRRAHYFISSGQAEPIGPYRIRFISRLELKRQIDAEVKIARISAGISVSDPEAGGIATLAQVDGLPCINPIKLIRDGREYFTPRAPACGRVRQIQAMLPARSPKIDVEIDSWCATKPATN